MDRRFSEIRRARWGTVCALVLTCVWVPATHAAQQDSSATSAAKKAAATKSPARKRHPSSSSTNSTGTAKSASSARPSPGTRSSRKKKVVRVRGQQKIDSDRARSIQEALIREHYMSGEASGTWNQASEDAMRKYQADHGWQSKQVPDSRALIKLGLGPSNDHLLNPESAMISAPDAPRSESLPTSSHTAAPSTDPAPVPNSDSSEPFRPQ